MDLKQIIKDNKIVVAYFWGKGCKDCENYRPIFEQVEKELQDVKFVKIDITDHKIRTEMDEIISGKKNEKIIPRKPTTLLWRDGRPCKIEPGLLSAAFLRTWIKH